MLHLKNMKKLCTLNAGFCSCVRFLLFCNVFVMMPYISCLFVMLMLHKLSCEGTNKDITTTTIVTVLGPIIVRTTVSVILRVWPHLCLWQKHQCRKIHHSEKTWQIWFWFLKISLVALFYLYRYITVHMKWLLYYYRFKNPHTHSV